MFDPDSRNDFKREQVLRAGEGPSLKRPPTSLLSIAGDDPAERHRQARLRREAAQVPESKQPDISSKPMREPSDSDHAVEKTSRPAGLLAGWTSRWTGKEDRAPSTPRREGEFQPAPPPAGEMRDFADERAASFHEADSQQWKPLIDPMKVIGGIASSKMLIASATVIGLLVGVAIAVTTPKKYEAAAELLVDPRDLNLVSRDLTPTGLSNEGTLAVVENQVRVLTSGSVLTKVVDRLNLENDPEFNGKGGSFGIGSLISGLRSLLSRSDSEAGGDMRHTLAVRNLSESLRVERGGKTFVIVIGAVTKDREKSALIANTTTEVFLETYGQIQSNTAGRAAEDLTSRLDQLREGVEAAERKVESFKAENDIIDAQGRLITDDEIVKLNEQLTVARARTLELNAKAPASRSVDVDAVLSGVLPEELASPTIQELRAQYSALKSEADRLAVRLGPRHPERMAIEAQLAGARDLLKTELRRIVSSTQTELKRAVQLEQELAARLAQLKVRQGDVSNELVTLRELEREASAKRAVYEAFLLRARETGEQSDLSTVNMSVISKANPPLDANPPSRSTMALTGLLLGFLTGVGFGGVRGAYESLRETANERSDSKRLKQREASRIQPESQRQTDLPQNAGVLPSHRGPLEQTPPAATMDPASEWPVQDQMHPADASYGVRAQHPARSSYSEYQPDHYAGGHWSQPPIYQPIHPGAYVQPQPSYPYRRHPEHMGSADDPVDMRRQPLYPAAPRHFAPPGAPPSYASASETDSSASIDEIRSSLREFREAVRDLAETRARRRYF